MKWVNVILTEFSANADMTFPNVVKLLLILAPSYIIIKYECIIIGFIKFYSFFSIYAFAFLLLI